MCVIIDANYGHKIVTETTEGVLLRDWIEARAGRLVAGGKNLTELSQNRALMRWLVALARAGRVHRIDDEQVNAEAEALSASGLCQSNDEHVIALARKGGARILFSGDQQLHADFLNATLLANPRGRVYQTSRHRRLLDDRNCCRRSQQ